MKSNWETSKQLSGYHFDPRRKDNQSDAMTYLGHLTPTWESDLTDIIANSKPVTWASRGYKGADSFYPNLAGEEYDLTSHGASKDFVITHLNWKLPPSLQAISNTVGLGNCMNRIHVQQLGESWNLHIDRLYRWAPDNHESVMRIFIQLTDWRPGQFWEFGNYHWNQWRAGDVVTFDWVNMPHCTANAGYDPRVTFQLTGIRTDRTMDFLANLAQ